MNGPAAISWFDSSSPTSRRIWASCGQLPVGRLVLFVAFGGGTACGVKLPVCARGKRFGFHLCEQVWCGREMLAGVEWSTPSAQPFTEEQMGASQLTGDARGLQPLYRLDIRWLGGPAVQQCARPGFQSQRQLDPLACVMIAKRG